MSASVRDRSKPQIGPEHGSAKLPALGFLEFSSIARGLVVTDLILKKAPVQVITSQPISSGKHVVLFFGDVASVSEAFNEGIANSDGALVKHVLIPGVHEKLAPFLESLWNFAPRTLFPSESVGIVESASLAASILAADRCLKTAPVDLTRMRLGQGIGGKAYFVISGRQDDVEAAVESASIELKGLDSLVRVESVPRPYQEALNFF